jgi:phosphoribosylaminoimidazole-succinocarboxamide synthase
MPIAAPPLFESTIKSLPLLGRGKVRDIYAVGEDKLLIVTTDRLSAFDVILPDPIPGKGAVLTAVANFWFGKLAHVVPNQLTGIDPESVVAGEEEKAQVRGRALVVQAPETTADRGGGARLPDRLRLEGLPGDGHGVRHSAAGRPADGPAIAGADFHPGDQGRNGRPRREHRLRRRRKADRRQLAKTVKDTTLRLYREAAAFARVVGIIIADTKFEFGQDEDGRLYLIDEVLTPDSSRFWPADRYKVGISPPSFDKQFVRDYLETLDWNKKAPGPKLPRDIIDKTAANYREALTRLPGRIRSDGVDNQRLFHGPLIQEQGRLGLTAPCRLGRPGGGQ